MSDLARKCHNEPGWAAHQIAGLEAQLAECRAVLREVEWSGSCDYGSSSCCPSCSSEDTPGMYVGQDSPERLGLWRTAPDDDWNKFVREHQKPGCHESDCRLAKCLGET